MKKAREKTLMKLIPGYLKREKKYNYSKLYDERRLVIQTKLEMKFNNFDDKIFELVSH